MPDELNHEDEVVTSADETEPEEKTTAEEKKQPKKDLPKAISSSDAEVVYEFLKAHGKPATAQTIARECGLDDVLSHLKALQAAGKIRSMKSKNKFTYAAN